MGPGQIFLTQVGLGQPPVNLKNFFKKSQFFSIWVKKISSGWLKKYLGQMLVGPLFTEFSKSCT